MGKTIIPHLGGVILHPGEFLPPGELHIPYTFRTYSVHFRTHSVPIPYKFRTSAHTPYRRSTSPPGKTISPLPGESSNFGRHHTSLRGSTSSGEIPHTPKDTQSITKQCNTKAIRINKFNKNKKSQIRQSRQRPQPALNKAHNKFSIGPPPAHHQYIPGPSTANHRCPTGSPSSPVHNRRIAGSYPKPKPKI